MKDQGEPSTVEAEALDYCNHFIGGPMDGREFWARYPHPGSWTTETPKPQAIDVRAMYKAEGEPQATLKFPNQRFVRLTFRGLMNQAAAADFLRQHGGNLGPDCTTPWPKVEVRCNAAGDRVSFWCPGCRDLHVIEARREGSGWAWNRDMGRPTVAVPLLVNPGRENPSAPRCHLVLADGILHFQPDCSHSLAGQDVPLPNIASGASPGPPAPPLTCSRDDCDETFADDPQYRCYNCGGAFCEAHLYRGTWGEGIVANHCPDCVVAIQAGPQFEGMDDAQG